MIPWKENCPHKGDGWCIECVSRLGDAIYDYLGVDGSEGRFSAVQLAKARLRVRAALASLELSDLPIE